MANNNNGSNRNNIGGRSLKAGFCLLLQAHDYAHDADTDAWQFGLEIDELRRVGLTNSDFRWMMLRGYVEQAQEITLPTDEVRVFRSLRRFTPLPESCFVLSESGVRLARRKYGDAFLSFADTPDGRFEILFGDAGSRRRSIAVDDDCDGARPTWDTERRELRLGDVLVKIFKWPACNQEMVLSVFQEEGWPARIDDPLPLAPEQEPKRRLHDTIKCLNRKQENRLIHFRGDGTGEGVIWEPQRDAFQDALQDDDLSDSGT